MSSYRQPFETYARETEPSSGAVDRIKRAQRRQATRRPLAWLAVPALAGIAAGIWALWPPQTLEGRLQAPTREERVLTDAIHLAYSGNGALSGTERDAHIQWEVGELEVEVEPHRGVALEVETLEGTVQVVGTAFSVTRSPLGTAVEVRRGHVVVNCASGAHADVLAGGSTLCLPVRPAGMLGRARTLRAQGAPTSEVLDAVTQGLALAPRGDPAIGELVALRLDVLITNGRNAEALAAAQDYLASGETARRAEISTIVEELRGR